MGYPQEQRRHYLTGRYTCPVTKTEVSLEASVPRPWVEWPIRVQCQACGSEHVLQYDDVLQAEPVFGHE